MAARVRDGIRSTASLDHRVGRRDARGQCGGQKKQRAFSCITVGHKLCDFDDAQLEGLAFLRPGNRGAVYLVPRFRQLNVKVETDWCARHPLTSLTHKVVGGGSRNLLRRQKLVARLWLDAVATEGDLALCIGELETVDTLI